MIPSGTVVSKSKTKLSLVTVKLIIVSVTNRATHDMATYLVDAGSDAKNKSWVQHIQNLRK